MRRSGSRAWKLYSSNVPKQNSVVQDTRFEEHIASEEGDEGGVEWHTTSLNGQQKMDMSPGVPMFRATCVLLLWGRVGTTCRFLGCSYPC